MTKEELKKEAEESAEKFFGKPTDLVDLDNLRIFKNGYLAGAEPREKQIEELEQELTVEKDQHQEEINLHLHAEEYIKSLEKENAELKKKYINNITDCDICDTYCNSQLIKAKELLNGCIFKARGNVNPSWSELINDIEQFLRGIDIDNAIQKANEGLDLDKIAEEVKQDLDEGCPNILCEDCTRENCTVRKLGLVPNKEIEK